MQQYMLGCRLEADCQHKEHAWRRLGPSRRDLIGRRALRSSKGLLADGTVVQNPLNGYQYAKVESFSPYTYNSIYIAGSQNCPMAKRESLQYLVSDDFAKTKAASEEVYDTLQTSWFHGHLLDDQR